MNILVTGASKGVGFEVVKKFAKDPSNIVIALSRDLESLQRLKCICEDQYNNCIHIHRIDFLSDSFSQDLELVLKDYGVHFDIIINNAGYLVNKPFTSTTSFDVESIFKVNLFAPITIMQKMFPFLDNAKRCHVVNIGSMGGVQGSVKFPGLSAYSASKAALANLTECLAEEYKEENVFVNCLALGSVQTEMLESAFPGYVAQVSAREMGEYIVQFALQDPIYINGKVIPLSNATP